MIVGDPFCFAINYDVVAEWNSVGDLWKNGIFFIYINGQRIGELDVVELRTTLSFYKKNHDWKISSEGAGASSRELYEAGFDLFYGEGKDNFYCIYDLTCTAFGDRGTFLFLCKTPNGERLVWSGSEGVNIEEVTLSPGTLKEVFSALSDDFY